MHLFRSWRVGRGGARAKGDGLAHSPAVWSVVQVACRSGAQAAGMKVVHRCTSIHTSAIAGSFSTMSGNARSEIGNPAACSHGDRYTAEGSHGNWRMYAF